MLLAERSFDEAACSAALRIHEAVELQEACENTLNDF
jgi:hypothetical protein